MTMNVRRFSPRKTGCLYLFTDVINCFRASFVSGVKFPLWQNLVQSKFVEHPFYAMKGCWLVFVNVLFFAYLPSLLCLNKCTEVCLKYYILLAQWCIWFIAPLLIMLFFCRFVHITLFRWAKFICSKFAYSLFVFHFS